MMVACIIIHEEGIIVYCVCKYFVAVCVHAQVT